MGQFYEDHRTHPLFTARPDVQNSLGKDELSAAVFRALMHGRMRVLPHNVQWVVDLIGPDRASACTSLPRVARLLRTSE